MLSPFDSPMSKNLVRMMAETVNFEAQQGGQWNPDGSCYNVEKHDTYVQEVYADSTNNYRIYRVLQYQPQRGYKFFSWDGASAPTGGQKTDLLRFLNGLRANPPQNSQCVATTNPGFTLLNSTLSQNWKGWEAYRDAHEASRAGCTDKSAPNYDSTALTLDNSCQFYKEKRSVHTKNSAKAADGVRFEGKVDFYSRQIPNADGSEGAEGKYVSTISEVCTDYRCEVNGEKRNVSVWNETSSTFDFSQNNDALNAAKSAAISALDAKVAELAGGYTDNCGLTSQSPTEYKKATSCDGLFTATMTKQLFTSNCDGSAEQIIYTASDGNSWTWVKGDGSSSAWEKDNIQDPNGRTAGYGGATDYVKTLVENYEKGLPSTTSITYDKVAQTSRGVVGAPNDGLFVVVVRATPVITDGCGKETQGASEYTYYGYQYTTITDQDSKYFNRKPGYDGLSDAGVPVVIFNDANINPTSTNVRDNNRAGTYEELYGKVISGCTDPNATNYDEEANTNRGCKYPLEDDGGSEFLPVQDTVNDGFNAGVLAITAVVFGGLYYFLR